MFKVVGEILSVFYDVTALLRVLGEEGQQCMLGRGCCCHAGQTPSACAAAKRMLLVWDCS